MPTKTHFDLIKSFIFNEIVSKNRRINETPQPNDHNTFIISAARRAGLEMKKVGPTYCFYDGNSLIGAIRYMKTSLVSAIALPSCSDKITTKILMENSGIVVPSGFSFQVSEYGAALEFFSSIQGPVTVKPSGGSSGIGITVGVSSEEELKAAWSNASQNARQNERIIVEEVVDGLDLRIYVIDGEVAACATRIAPFVVGDGQSKIHELVISANQQREKHGYLKKHPMVISDSILAEQGLMRESILSKDQVAILGRTTNIGQGGLHMDLTGQIDPDICRLAIQATEAIPGLRVAGVDIMVDDVFNPNHAAVIEVNTAADISVHQIPAIGEPIDMGAKIVEALLREHQRHKLPTDNAY
ncbi:ATP-binding protein [Corynebacterium cystitidis]|uniref:ATP-binding protein n=1 Tax=Corynebacterium cystitidis TaxID=35757 RepID=UPI00211DF78E|nr:hypothetical protein [Corynebacterium cystitidis]